MDPLGGPVERADRVVAGAGAHVVEPAAGVDHVAARAAVDPLRTVAAGQQVRARAALDALDVTADVVALARLAVVRDPVERRGHGRAARGVADQVEARAAAEAVRARVGGAADPLARVRGPSSGTATGSLGAATSSPWPPES